jgi:hypothetical protein
MKEPGLDNRHRDKNAPKAGEIQQKRGDTLNKNLPKPIQFSPNAKLATTRAETGKTGVDRPWSSDSLGSLITPPIFKSRISILKRSASAESSRGISEP